MPSILCKSISINNLENISTSVLRPPSIAISGWKNLLPFEDFGPEVLSHQHFVSSPVENLSQHFLSGAQA